MTLAYTSELTPEQFELLHALLPPAATAGRPRSVNLLSVVQAIVYVLASGCAWRLLPSEYPAPTVYDYFRKWRNDGTWRRVPDHLAGWVRVIEGHPVSPSAGSLDSQTVPSAVMVQQAVSDDAGKQTKGRKRFTLVDTLGLLLVIKVVAASTPDREGAKQVHLLEHQERHRLPHLTRIWVDGGCSGIDFLR